MGEEVIMGPAMKTPTRTVVSSVLWLLAIPLAARAAEPSHRCAEQVSDAQRLACYDLAFGKPARASAAPAAAAASAAKPPPVETPAAQVEKKAQAQIPASAPTARSTEITASIAALRQKLDGRYEATLQNGEVWSQLEPDRWVELAVGDTVTIRPAALGSHMLVTKAGIRTRVKRVE
jgi:hypothetical protein